MRRPLQNGKSGPWGGPSAPVTRAARRRQPRLRRLGFTALIGLGLAGGFWAAGTPAGGRLAADGAALFDGVFASPSPRPLSTRVVTPPDKTHPRAPLTVRAHAELSHFVKLVDLRTGQVALAFTLAAGERIRTEAPYGRYEFRVASGETWYGETHLFGRPGLIERAREPIVFSRRGGHEIDLNRRIDGNMATERTPKSRF